MTKAKVDGALIVQPINYKYDHSYVTSAIERYPTKFKGMLLHDPSLDKDGALSRLEELVLKGFVGVRFNPYLWPEGKLMSEEGGAGVAVYKRCAELGIPVGVMCFKGLDLHYDDILKLLQVSPDTTLILDHMGFTSLDEKGDEAFKQLLSLSKYPSVVVKISALFRVSRSNDSFPYEVVHKKRFHPLLEAFGAERLLFGTDFPYVLVQEGGYVDTTKLIRSWATSDFDQAALMGGNAERLFGFWGSPEPTS